MEPRELTLGGRPFVFCMFPTGTKLVPNATLRGMECQHPSGAQRRARSRYGFRVGTASISPAMASITHATLIP